MRYSNVSKNKENGVVYTPASLAAYTAGSMLKYYKSKSSDISILDPAIGGGELVIALLERLHNKYKTIRVVGYETDATVASTTEAMLRDRFPSVAITIIHGDFIDAACSGNVERFDLVIANPPYVRIQIMGSARAHEISTKLSMKGRIDLYYAFLVCIKDVLKESGIAGFITSNKFMTIKSGTYLRNFMLDNYSLHHITDLGDTKIFKAAVLPCVLVLSLGKTKDNRKVLFTSVYESRDNALKFDSPLFKEHLSNNDLDTIPVIDDVFDKIELHGLFQTKEGQALLYKQGHIGSTEHNANWTLSSNESEHWLEAVDAKTKMRFADIGKIRVGIKTTADEVFISNDWSGIKADLELLRPLITHQNAGQLVPRSDKQFQVLYPHTTKDGKRVARDLNLYPKSKAYLEQHYDRLNSRKYLKKAKRKWYEIWVPQHPEHWAHRKIVFTDISAEPQFWLDDSGAIVNGDCYWIDIKPSISEDLVYLALAVANSKFIERFYDTKFNTKLYSGKRRYQTQYVEDFPIPREDTDLAQKAIGLVKSIIHEGSSSLLSPIYKSQLDDVIEEIFC